MALEQSPLPSWAPSWAPLAPTSEEPSEPKCQHPSEPLRPRRRPRKALQHPAKTIVVASAAALEEELTAALECGAWAKDCETASGPLVRQV